MGRLRLLTYNVHKCVGGLDRRYDPERVAAAIGHYSPDVVLLQEVNGLEAKKGRQDQADLLADRLGYRWRAHFPNVRSLGRGPYGNALLSRHPILEAEHLDLTFPLKKKRGVLHARLRVRLGPGRSRTLHVFNLHLGLAGLERRWQIARFLQAHPFARLHRSAPIVVGGDFNDLWGSMRGQLAPAGFDGAAHHHATFPAFAPLRALDGLYARGGLRLLHCQRGQLEACRWASDHLPLIADYALA